jgi:hypothetical protein
MATTHQAMKRDTDQTSRNEAATRRWIEEVGNRRNAAVVDELLSPDFEAHSLFHNPYRPSWLRPGSSIERQKKTIEQDVMGLENRHTTIDQMIANAPFLNGAVHYQRSQRSSMHGVYLDAQVRTRLPLEKCSRGRFLNPY